MACSLLLLSLWHPCCNDGYLFGLPCTRCVCKLGLREPGKESRPGIQRKLDDCMPPLSAWSITMPLIVDAAGTRHTAWYSLSSSHHSDTSVCVSFQHNLQGKYRMGVVSIDRQRRSVGRILD